MDTEGVSDAVDRGEFGIGRGLNQLRVSARGFEKLHLIFGDSPELGEFLLSQISLESECPNRRAKLLGECGGPRHIPTISTRSCLSDPMH